MSKEAKSQASVDPFEIGQITERIPAWEVWEDGIEPADEGMSAEEREHAA